MKKKCPEKQIAKKKIPKDKKLTLAPGESVVINSVIQMLAKAIDQMSDEGKLAMIYAINNGFKDLNKKLADWYLNSPDK